MEENELLDIRNGLEERKNKIGLVGARLNIRNIDGNSLSAYITTDWKEIDISYGKELDLAPDKETKEYIERRKIRDVKRKTGEDILEHEAGHRENKVGEAYGCPYDIETHDIIKDSIAKGLDKIGKTGLESYVTNAFEDILDNVNCRRHTDFAGQALFWNNQGIVNGENGKFNSFYEAFVKINLFLGGNLSDYSLLNRFFKNEDRVNGAFRGFIQVLRSKLDEERIVKLHEKDGFDRLFEYDKDRRAKLWAELGYAFAVRVGCLIDELPKQRMFGNAEGDENSDEQNPFDREMKIPWNRQKIAFGRYKQRKGVSKHRELEEQLYDLYKAISKEIKIETSSYGDSQAMPLVHFGRRFVKDEEQKFRFKGLGFKENGEIGLKTTKHYIEHPVSYKRRPHQFKKFKLSLFDRSGSMALNPDNGEQVGDNSFIPWGDNSKYHYALKGYFGIDNFFERQGIGKYIESCVLGFSGESAVRGNSEKTARALLTKPSGGTSLDIGGLEKELEEDSLVISISDGELDIDEEEKERFESKLRGCDYAHFQIGKETDFSSYLSGLGVPVISVKGDDDLSKAMVSFVSGYYKSREYGGKKR